MFITIGRCVRRGETKPARRAVVSLICLNKMIDAFKTMHASPAEQLARGRKVIFKGKCVPVKHTWPIGMGHLLKEAGLGH